MDGLDPSLTEKVLQSKEVQEAMKKAGEKALSDPAVQQIVIDKAKELFTPENAAMVADTVKQWAQDPVVQAKARHYAGMAMEYAGTASAMFVGVIEQGPSGVRLLAFFVSLASVVVSILSLINIFGVFYQAAGYALDVYQALFSLTTMLFEAKPEWIEKVTGLNKYQNLLIEYCKFLTMVLGRGLFYLFQGTLWLLTTTSFFDVVSLAVGGLYIVVAVFHICMHWGIMPQHVVAKVKDTAMSGYSRMAA